ncbi:MAG: hypothetical protein PHH44_01350 [bacterium]|nr:hypothetical protein [bacterium]
MKMTKQNTNNVVNKVKQSSVFRLSSEEVSLYLSIRLIDLINRECVVGYDELIYRLCEVGPGNLRFDPLSVTIFINSKIGQELLAENGIEFKNKYFHSHVGGLNAETLQVKSKIVKSVNQQIYSQKTATLLKQKIESICKESNYLIIESLINKNKNHLEFLLKTRNNAGNILIRIYNTVEWIYPDSWQIWDVYQKANKERCIPIIVASKIHGSCFPLFKALGVLARTTYGPFTEQSIDEIKEEVLNKKDKALLSVRAVLPIKVNSLSNNSAAQSLKGIKQLLTSAIPDYLDQFAIRFDKSAKRIVPCLLAELKPLLDDKINSLKPAERLSRIKGILALKVGHLNLVKDFVKRHEDLIIELKTDKA